MMDVPFSVRQLLYSGISKKLDFLKMMYKSSDFIETDSYKTDMIDIEEAVAWYKENFVLSAAFLVKELNELKEIRNEISK